MSPKEVKTLVNTTNSDTVLVYIAFGSNIGNRVDYIKQMMKALEGIGGAAMRCSTLWLSEATGMGNDAGDFLNGVVELRTKLSAVKLLDSLQRIEISMGRPADHEENAARVIDLDIISYGDYSISTPRLTVPHPRAHERLFVLKPLLELAPDLKLHGFDQTVAELVEIAPPMRISKQLCH